MDKIPYLLKRDVFSDKELRLIFDELQFLNNSHLMEPPENTASAGPSKFPLKKNNGVFLHNVYCRQDVSSIGRLLKDRLVKQYLHEYSELHITNITAAGTNNAWFLVSYYKDGDYYLRHRDATNHTALFWFNKKEFTGGDLTFDGTNETIKYKNNSMIIFPSWAEHSVSKVCGEGRYCVTVGLHIEEIAK